MSDREQIQPVEPVEQREEAHEETAHEDEAQREGAWEDEATDEVEMLDPEALDSYKHHHFPGALDIVAMALLLFISQIVVSALCMACGLTLPNVAELGQPDIETTMQIEVLKGERFAIIYPLSMLAAFLSIWLYVRLRDGKGVVARFSRKGFNPNIILTYFIWIVAAQVLIEPLLEILPEADNGGTGRGFWASITAIVFAPFFEELICRGVVLETLRRRWGKFVSVIIASLFFGIIHIEPAVAVSAIVAGFIFGTAYLRTSSLFSTMILHSLNNAFAFALIVFGFSDISFVELFGGGVEYYVVYALCALVCISCFAEAFRKVYRKDIA